MEQPDEGRREELTRQVVKARFEWLRMEKEESDDKVKVEELNAKISSLEKDLDGKLREALQAETDFETVRDGRSEVGDAEDIVGSLAEAKAHLAKRQARMEEMRKPRGEKKEAYERVLKELVATLSNRPPGFPVR